MAMNRAAGILVAAAGLLLIAVVELLQPVGRLGLYDGLITEDPYRFVNPTADQTGSPTSAMATLDVSTGTSPAIVLATAENPPQAQFIATPGSLAIVAGSTTLTASITPVAASAAESAATTIYGNVYSYVAVDQAGNAVGLAPGAQPTVVLRAPFGAPSVSIARWDGQAWQPIATGTGATPDILTGPVDGLGDFALIPGAPRVSIWFVVGLAVLLVGVLGVGFLFIRRPRRRGSQRKRGGGST